MAYENYTNALMEMKRRAQLSGRPLAASEVAGMTEGAAAGASQRVYNKQALDLQGKALAEQKRQANLQYKMAKDAMEAEEEAAKYSGIQNAGTMAGAYLTMSGNPQIGVPVMVASQFAPQIGGWFEDLSGWGKGATIAGGAVTGQLVDWADDAFDSVSDFIGGLF